MNEEEKKDEMKNKISMALKDPILQQGFEIFCRDLETEKRKLKIETELSKRLGIAYREFEQLTKEQDEHLADLVKENAELKARLNAINLLTPELQKRSQLKTQQLTKAKEIIRKLVLEVKGYEEINGYDTCEPVKEAEQFLSEVENDKEN